MTAYSDAAYSDALIESVRTGAAGADQLAAFEAQRRRGYARLLRQARHGQRLVCASTRIELFAVSPDGKWCAHAGFRPVLVWRVSSVDLQFHARLDVSARALAFSADGSRLLVGTLDALKTFVLAPEVDHTPTVLAMPGPIAAIASARGRTVAGGEFGARVIEDGATRDLATGPVKKLLLVPDGETLVAGTVDGHLATWDCARGVELGRTRAHDTIQGMTVTADGDWVVTMGAFALDERDSDATMKVFSRSDLRLAHALEIGPDCLGARPGGSQVAVACGKHRTIELFAVVAGKRLGVVTSHEDCSVEGIGFDPRGKRMLSASYQGGNVLFTELGAKRGLRTLSQISGVFDSSGRFAVGPSGIAYEGEPDEPTLRHASWKHGGECRDGYRSAADDSEGFVDYASLGESGNLVVILTREGNLRLWQPDWLKLTAFPSNNRVAAIGAFGAFVAVGYADGKLDLWRCPPDGAVNRLTRESSLHPGVLSSLAARGAGDRWLATSPAGKLLSIAFEGRAVTPVEFEAPVTTVRAGPTSVVVRLGGGAPVLLDADLRPGPPLQAFGPSAGDDGWGDVACGARGEIAASRGNIVTLCGPDGRPLRRLEAEGEVRRLAFTPCGRGLFIGTPAGIHFWDALELVPA